MCRGLGREGEPSGSLPLVRQLILEEAHGNQRPGNVSVPAGLGLDLSDGTIPKIPLCVSHVLVMEGHSEHLQPASMYL